MTFVNSVIHCVKEGAKLSEACSGLVVQLCETQLAAEGLQKSAAAKVALQQESEQLQTVRRVCQQEMAHIRNTEMPRIQSQEEEVQQQLARLQVECTQRQEQTDRALQAKQQAQTELAALQNAVDSRKQECQRKQAQARSNDQVMQAARTFCAQAPAKKARLNRELRDAQQQVQILNDQNATDDAKLERLLATAGREAIVALAPREVALDVARGAVQQGVQRLAKSRRDAAAATERAEAEASRRRLCVVCEDHPRTEVMVPCGHWALCEGCAGQAARQRMCPCCRRPVVSTMRIYVP